MSSKQFGTMRIFIEHSGHQLLNHGDTSMLQAAILRLKKIWPEAVIHVLTSAEDRLTAFCPGSHAIHPETRIAWINISRSGIFPKSLLQKFSSSFCQRVECVEKYFCTKKPKLYASIVALRLKLRNKPIMVKNGYKYIDSIINSDLVIATGGGYLTDVFKGYACRVLDTIQLAIDHGKPTALLGQGIGPVSDRLLEQKMCRTLPNVDLISLREQRKGLPILLQQGVKRSRIIVTGDDAIEFAYQVQTSTLGDRLGLNFRMASYADVDNTIKDSVIDLLRRFAEKHATSIVPIPISFHNQGEDLRAIEEITDCDPQMGHKGVDFDTPQKIISWISQCRLVVTGSYHAGVFALSQGIPVIGLANSIYYKDKFFGLSDQFGDGCQTLLLDQPDWNEILSLVLEKFWSQAPVLKPKLLAAAKRQIESGQAAYQSLRELVGR